MPRSSSRLVLSMVALSCAPAPAAVPDPEQPSVAAAKPTPSSAPAAAPAAPPFERFATLKSSGADECQVELRPLGPAGSSADVAIGFGPDGGLAAWKAPGDRSISLAAVSADGRRRAALRNAAVPPSFKPRHIVAIDRGFVVIGLLYAWMHSRWHAISTDATGKPLGPGTELELEHRYIQDVSPSRARGFVIFATRALMVPSELQGLRGRWLAIEVGADGKLEQRVHELALSYPLVRALDQVHPLEIAGKPGWFIALSDETKGELLADGKLERVSREELAARGIDPAAASPPDRVEIVMSLDHAGLQFHRAAGGRPIGKPTQMPEGSAGILDAMGWSGSRWVIAHATQADGSSIAQLVVIDCRRSAD